LFKQEQRFSYCLPKNKKKTFTSSRQLHGALFALGNFPIKGGIFGLPQMDRA